MTLLEQVIERFADALGRVRINGGPVERLCDSLYPNSATYFAAVTLDEIEERVKKSDVMVMPLFVVGSEYRSQVRALDFL